MMLPEGRHWLASAKTFAAATMALGIGFAADLDRPYWAMATVYIVTQPTAAMTRAKAVYRLLGTLLGAAAAITLVPNLVDGPPLLVAALAGWIGLCLFLSLLDRTPSGYVFMLGGYTAAIIGFPSVTAPGDIFAVAIARTEEIGLGVVCATLVSMLVFPVHLGPVVARRMEAWKRDAGARVAEVLRGKEATAEAAVGWRRLAADAVELGIVAGQLRYDTAEHRASLAATRALHARLVMVAPVLDSIADRLAELRRDGELDPAVAAMLPDFSAWAETGSDMAPLVQRLEAARRRMEAGASWAALRNASLIARLCELRALLEEADMLGAHIRTGRPGLPFVRSELRVPAAPRHHTDILLALHSGLAVALTTALVCIAWIATGWPQGAAAAQMAAIVSCFFATRDDPAPAMLHFLERTVESIVVVGVFLFAVLPALDGFPSLVAALAPAFLVLGALGAMPATAATGTLLAVNTATLMALQETYSADFAAFVNSSLATVAGMAGAVTMTRLVRSLGVDWATRRLVRANWSALLAAAINRGRGDRAAFAASMLDRIGLVMERAGNLSTAGALQPGRLLADLRVGLNIVDLRRARHTLAADAVGAIDAVLDALAQHYATLLRGGPGGEARVGTSLRAAFLALAPLPPSEARRDALLGLLGIRLCLLPDPAARALPDYPQPLAMAA